MTRLLVKDVAVNEAYPQGLPGTGAEGNLADFLCRLPSIYGLGNSKDLLKMEEGFI